MKKASSKKVARAIAEDKWKRKKYLQECNSDTIKVVTKIRRHMVSKLEL